jgi:hypothetical protein
MITGYELSIEVTFWRRQTDMSLCRVEGWISKRRRIGVDKFCYSCSAMLENFSGILLLLFIRMCVFNIISCNLNTCVTHIAPEIILVPTLWGNRFEYWVTYSRMRLRLAIMQFQTKTFGPISKSIVTDSFRKSPHYLLMVILKFVSLLHLLYPGCYTLFKF